MNKLALKKRWLNFHNIDEILKATENLKTSPFGETPEGLVDFRGIPLFTTPIETGGGWVNKSQKIDIYKSDFSYSEWKGFDIKESIIKDCIFNAVKFVGNIYFYSNYINNCIFTACSFKDVHFTKSKIIKTIFEKITHKDRFSFDTLKIDSCRFEGDLKKIHFWASPISQTEFVGSMTDCTFYGHPQIISLGEKEYKALMSDEVANRMDNVDFSRCSIIMCNFTCYCYLDKVIPPNIENNCISQITPEFYDEGLSLIEKSSSTIKSKFLSNFEMFFKPDPRVPYEVLGPKDHEKYFGVEESRLYYEIFVHAAINAGTKV